jgi:hypothetical protein
MDFRETYHRGFPIRASQVGFTMKGVGTDSSKKATKLLKRLGSVPKPDERIPTGIQGLTYRLLSIKDWRSRTSDKAGKSRSD